MDRSERIDIDVLAEENRNAIADNAENNGNKAFRIRSHPLGRSVIRIVRAYAVILQPFIGENPEKPSDQGTSDDACHNGKNVINRYIHNQLEV